MIGLIDGIQYNNSIKKMKMYKNEKDILLEQIKAQMDKIIGNYESDNRRYLNDIHFNLINNMYKISDDENSYINYLNAEYDSIQNEFNYITNKINKIGK